MMGMPGTSPQRKAAVPGTGNLTATEKKVSLPWNR
jgi:hypothetical protein